MTSRLRSELGRDWRPPRFVAPQRLAIEPVAQEIQRRFGGAPQDPAPPKDVLAEIEDLLIAQGGDLRPLSRRQLKALPHILWASPKRWSEHEGLVGAYLQWAAQDWPRAPRWLWRHYLLNLDPGSLATRRLGSWLAERADRLPQALADPSRDWDLLDPSRGVQRVADSLLDGDAFILVLEGLQIHRGTIERSAFLLAVLEALGGRLRRLGQGCGVAQTLKALLADLGDRPLAQMQGPEDLRDGALRSLVEGLVAWADPLGEPWVGETLDLLYPLIGDPRLHPGRWQAIDASARETVDRWLTKATLDTFFRFMREVATDRPDMVRERETFWRGYDGRIVRAWLVTGREARAKARVVFGESFGTFETESNVHPDHLGLLIQISGLAILEMNKTGYTLFWPAGDPGMPGFFERRYSRSQMLDACPTGPETGAERFRLRHTKDTWPDRYRNVIGQRSGVWLT